MKGNIRCIVVSILLSVAASDVLAITPQEQKEAAIAAGIRCSAIYQAYGVTDNYQFSLYEAGVQLGKNTRILAKDAGVDSSLVTGLEMEALVDATSMRGKTSIIPPSLDSFCSGVYKGAENAVARIQ